MRTAIFSLFAFFIFFSLFGFYWAIRPVKLSSAVTPKDFGIPYENISFRTSDNIRIHGWFIPSSTSTKKTVILLHGYPANKNDILPAMIFLHSKFNLLLFDFRYFGESEGYYSTAGIKEVNDLLAAIQYLKSRDIDEAGIWGFSMGAAVALMTAPKTSAIKAIVAESPYARLDWMTYDYYRLPLLQYPLGELTRLWGILFFGYDLKRISPANSARDLTIPILLIHSKQDTVVPYKHGELLQEEMKNNPNLQVILLENIKHGQSVLNHKKIIMEFFEKNL